MGWWVWTIGCILFLGILLFLFLRFVSRNPERKISKGSSILSPADGKVIEIISFDNAPALKVEKNISKVIAHTEDIAEKGYLITIFMRWHDVHVNRSPIDGTVVSLKHRMGEFYSAKNPEAILTNEYVETIIQGTLKIKVIQIAGMFFRRIKTFVKKDQRIGRGDILGRIAFGSQAVLILPKNTVLKVKKGSVVKAGKTVIATIASDAQPN
ncbi:phosphatidylserine decarboxylase family protein [Candidatus Woesearchaeota archaeon]|nr:MAG: phosphatidylserine decarboxylase family protein [Candidatus Woesearchaeota archaeon]